MFFYKHFQIFEANSSLMDENKQADSSEGLANLNNLHVRKTISCYSNRQDNAFLRHNQIF